MPRKIAFYGGSFDPIHLGHLTPARALIKQFLLDEFVFIPAFHAPHKLRQKPTSAFHRFAMLCSATADDERIKVSTIEVELPEKPFTINTLSRLKVALPNDEIYFVMGADSWNDILTWRDWEKVLLLTNHIIVTRPGHEIRFDHVGDKVRNVIVDLRRIPLLSPLLPNESPKIYISDVVNLEISATAIRRNIIDALPGWREEVPVQVANYIEKYQIYR